MKSNFKLIFLVLLISNFSFGQIGQINIEFNVDESNAFYDTFEDNIQEMEYNMAEIIKNELNKFFKTEKFVTQKPIANTDNLKVTLLGVDENAYFERYILKFEFGEKGSFPLDFLSSRKFFDTRNSTTRIYIELGYVIEIYLDENLDAFKSFIR